MAVRAWHACWRNCALLLLALWLLPLPVVAQEPATTVTLAEYHAWLQAAIGALEAAPAETAQATLQEWQRRLATIAHVERAGGELVAVAPPLGEPRDADESADETPEPLTVASALVRLKGVVAQLDAAPGDNTAARLAILDEVLARPELNSPASLLERLLTWLEEWWRRLFPNFDSDAANPAINALAEGIPWVLAVIGIVLILWLLTFWIQRLARAFVTDSRGEGGEGDPDMPRTAAEARQQARVAAQSGLYRDAVRRLYLAALLQLAEHELIVYERSLTNREVLMRVPVDAPIRPYLEPVVATFDQVWYGVREPDQATFMAYERAIDALGAVVRRTPAKLPGSGT